MNSLACSKYSLFDSASLRKTNLHKGLSRLHFNSAQKTETVGNAQLHFMQQKPIYKLWLYTQYALGIVPVLIKYFCKFLAKNWKSIYL